MTEFLRKKSWQQNSAISTVCNCELHSNRILMSCRVAILSQIFRENNVFPNKSYYKLIWRNFFQVCCCTFLIFQHSTLHAALIKYSTYFNLTRYFQIISWKIVPNRKLNELISQNFCEKIVIVPCGNLEVFSPTIFLEKISSY